VRELVVRTRLVAESLVDLTIAIVIDIVAGLFCGNGSLANPTGRANASSLAHTYTKSVRKLAGLRVSEAVIDQSIAVIVHAVARFQRGEEGITIAPSAQRVASLEAKASPNVIGLRAASFAAIGKAIALATAAYGQTYVAHVRVSLAGGFTGTVVVRFT
jgi:hypothetical protein